MQEIINKIRTREELKNLLKNTDQGTGFTSGSFDILHAGHVDYLQKAKGKCDILVVALNSDKSVREYKSADRPIVGEDARAKLLAALECVDYVFLFDEVNNNQNIETLKPDIYFKASDYNKSALSSAEIVESYGGRVELIDVVEDTSTTQIINKILEVHSAQKQAYIPKEAYEKAPAIILDRDGTINVGKEYLRDPEQFELIDGVGTALKQLQDAGFRLVVITNQPAVGMGYFEMERVFSVNKKMLSLLSKDGVIIHKIYFSPYTKADGTDCRKPATALVERAKQELNLDIQNSYVIGDTTSDIQLGKNAGCKTVLVQTGHAGKDGLFDVEADFVVEDLSKAAEQILEKENG